MGRFTVLLVAVGTLYQQALVSAADWHFLSRYVPSGAQITAFNGNMTIPPHIAAETSYLWPGLQTGNGVFQTVLDGRAAKWWISSGWVGSSPSYPWGGGFNVEMGQSIHFDYTSNSTGWTVTLTGPNGDYATNFFEGMQSTIFNEVVFAIELYGAPWDFGPLTFDTVSYTVSGTSATYWCTDNPTASGLTHWKYDGATTSILAGSSICCNIDTIALVDDN